MKEHGREWKPLGALRVGQPLLPELCRVLTHNAYFALNTSYGKPKPRYDARTRESWQPIPGQPPTVRPHMLAKLEKGEYGVPPSLVPRERVTRTVTEAIYQHPDTGLPLVAHDNSTLRWLNCAYADIDCYRLGLSIGDAFGAIVDMQNAGTLPPATLVAQSGRGLWLLWLLVDTKNPTEGERTIHGQIHAPWTSQRASSRAMRLYARVQRALVDKLAHLGADLGAVDGPRYAPVPGTQKTTGTARVLYWAQHLGDGLPVYTVQSLCDALGLETTRHEHAVIAAAFPDGKNPQNVTKGKRGHEKRWLYQLADLETLYELRDGYGNARSRHQAALFHAVTLKRAGMSPADMEQRVRRYWQRSRTLKPDDALEDRELADVFRQARKRQTPYTRLRREAYLLALNVTPEELSYLDATSQRPHPQTAPTNATHRTERRTAILQSIHETFGGHVPSCRTMAEYLTAQGVPCGNSVTVWRDYKALGLEPVAAIAKGGRPPKLPL